MDAIVVYCLHWVFCIGALAFSWRRSGHYMHPHFLFTCMLVVYLSDFLTRGYDDQNLYYIRQEDVLIYQLIILAILSIIVFTTAFVRNPALEGHVRQIATYSEVRLGAGIRFAIYVLAMIVLGMTLYKRFSMVNWSLDEVIRQSLSPRGDRDWDREAYSGNFVLAIISILLPFAAVASAYLFATGRGAGRYAALPIFTLVVAILVTDGSRTPVAIAFASLAMFLVLRYKTRYARLLVLAAVGGIMIAIFSLMILFRSTGYLDTRANKDREYSVTYHQDDNYYRAIFAYAHSEQTGKHWDPWFFFTTIAANPIPRAIWPKKPLLDATFYDGFKLDYVTNSFIGEGVAMSGVGYSIFFGPVVGYCLYLIMFSALRLLPKPMGFGAYLVAALYVYMCIRSLLNLTHFIYFPAFSVGSVLILEWLRNRGRPRMSPPLVMQVQRS